MSGSASWVLLRVFTRFYGHKIRRFVSCFFFKSVCIFVHDNHDHDNHDHACRHGGMCRVRRHGLYCECLPGFMGTRCEGLFRASFSSHCAFSNTDSMITIAKAISVTSTIVTITIAKTIIVTMGQFHRRVVARV